MTLDNKTRSAPVSSPRSGDVRLDTLSFSIGSRHLFQDMSHTFPSHQWTCLLGRSGIGKSMLLRTILGLTDQTIIQKLQVSGSVTWDHVRPLTDNTSYMAQQDMLMPWLSVRDNVMLGARLRGGTLNSGNHERANSLLQQVGLLDRADDLPDSLSGGMRQRAALARTLWEDRPIVLMDEPFSALDAISRLQAQNLAAALLQNRTVIMVTHDPLEAIRLSHEIIVLAGEPAKIIDAPIRPEGTVPRPVDDEAVLKLQGELLHRLSGETQ